MLRKIQIMIEDNEGETDSYGLARDILDLFEMEINDRVPTNLYLSHDDDGFQDMKYKIARDVIEEYARWKGTNANSLGRAYPIMAELGDYLQKQE